jgi:hypothetical protein
MSRLPEKQNHAHFAIVVGEIDAERRHPPVRYAISPALGFAPLKTPS